jgi:hypothetical protein
MTALFVGQRVRIVMSRNLPHLVGREGRIVEIVGPYPTIDGVGAALAYGLDIKPIERTMFGVYGWGAHQLEPILPEGMKPSEWSKCLWQPEGVEA